MSKLRSIAEQFDSMSLLMYIVQQLLYMDDVIQCPLCILYIVNRSAEVRGYKRVHKLVNREDKSMSHIVLS